MQWLKRWDFESNWGGHAKPWATMGEKMTQWLGGWVVMIEKLCPKRRNNNSSSNNKTSHEKNILQPNWPFRWWIHKSHVFFETNWIRNDWLECITKDFVARSSRQNWASKTKSAAQTGAPGSLEWRVNSMTKTATGSKVVYIYIYVV